MLSKISRAGTHLYNNLGEWHGIGVNETVVLPYGLQGDTSPSLRYKNYLFPSPTGWGETVMPSANWDEFWWRYFSLCKYYKRNHVRMGDTNPYGFGQMWNAYFFKPYWDEVIGSMFKMANLVGVYVVIQFGSAGLGYTVDSVTGRYGKATSLSHPLGGDIFHPGTPGYNRLVSGIGQMMREYASEPAIAMWDVYNEATNVKNPDGTWFFPTRDSYKAWAQRYVGDVIAQDHSHLISLGGAQGSGNPWSGFTQDNYNAEWDNPQDVAQEHAYGSLTGWVDSGSQLFYYIKKRKQWADLLGKPLYIGEFGWGKRIVLPSGVTAPYSYWQEFEDQCKYLDYAATAQMVLSNMPGYPPSADMMASVSQVPYGYPVQCADGSVIYTKILVNGQWIPSGQTCR